MQASPTAPDLRPLGIGEVLDVAIKIYLGNAATLFKIVLLIVAPVQVFSSFIQVSAQIDEDPFTTTSTTGQVEIDTDEIWLYATGFGILLVLALISSTLATGACFKAVSDAYLGERPTWSQSLRFALRRVHSIIWITILGTLLAMVGAVFCILPGIWLYVAFSVAVPVLLTEAVHGRRALGRSFRLVRGRWWPVFGILVLGSILAAVVAGLITGVLGALSLADPDNELVAFVLGAVGGTVSSTLTTPFQAAFVTVLYFDLRVRKEGFDLQLLAERIGLAAPGEGGFRPAPAALPPVLPQRPAAPAGGGEAPPYWPPPPGWTPSEDPGAPPGLGPTRDPDQPPYWPPPPGWKPSSER